MKTGISIILLLFMNALFAQKKEYVQIDKKILSIPVMDTYELGGIASFINQNFSTENEKVRAIYVWITHNISYDVDNLLALDYSNKKKKRVGDALKNGRAICQGYSELFDTLCNKCNIHSYVIEGYTRQSWAPDYLAHAWAAAFINGKWYLFDPTWGAGYLNGYIFKKKFSEDYFMVLPEKMIKTHMPFDPTWEFLEHPLNNVSFAHGEYDKKSVETFNYLDTINHFLQLDEIAKSEALLRRMAQNKINNSILIARYADLQRQIVNEKQNKASMVFNDAVNDYNESINLFNEYINYKNKQFTPLKSDEEIKKMIANAVSKATDAYLKLSSIKEPGLIANNINSTYRSMDALKQKITDESRFLEKYFKKKTLRKSLFYTRLN